MTYRKVIKMVDGKTCSSCGRTKRRAHTRTCVFCEFWEACRIIEGEIPASKKRREQAWRSFVELGDDHKIKQGNKRKTSARRGRERGADGHHNAGHLAAILKAQHSRCAYCDATADLQLDHVVPLARGGSNWPWNLQYLCGSHNASKSDRTDAEYRALIGLPAEAPVSTQLWIAVFAA